MLNSELGKFALYTGPDPVDGPAPFADFMKLYIGPPVARLRMNAMGDIAFTDEHENFEAYNLTSHSPEPSTWILLATGAVGVLSMMRRRMASGALEGALELKGISYTQGEASPPARRSTGRTTTNSRNQC